MKKIALLLLERCYASGAIGIVDLLDIAQRLVHAASRPGPFTTRLFSLDGQAVDSANGMALPVSGRLEDAQWADIIIVPGLVYGDVAQFETFLCEQAPWLPQLRAWHAQGKTLAATCTAVALLAEAQILHHREATISWWLNSWFRQRYPSVRLQAHALLVNSPGVLCSGAMTSFSYLALHLIAQEAGADIARQCARFMLIDSHRESQAPFATMQQYNGHQDALVTRAQAWLSTQLQTPFQLELLAAELGTSARTVLRHFQSVLGCTPLNYLQQLRLQQARHLLETTDWPLGRILDHIGYADISTFGRLFKREMGCTPAAYRQRFSAPSWR